MKFSEIENALDEARFETARRLCEISANASNGEQNQLLMHLHLAYRDLCDISSARAALERVLPQSEEERLEVCLRLAEDFHRGSAAGYYRDSEEKQAGLTGEEYESKMEASADRYFQKSIALAQSPSTRRQVAQVMQRCRRGDDAAKLLGNLPPESAPPVVKAAGAAKGVVSGKLRFDDGAPVAGALVTLGLAVEVEEPDPATYLVADMGYAPKIAAQSSLTCRTDERGKFQIEGVPVGRHAFLAVSLDPARFDIATRFLAHEIQVNPNEETRIDAEAGEWISAPPRELVCPFGLEATHRGHRYRRVYLQPLKNPFHFDFPRQLIEVALPADIAANPRRLLLLDSEAPAAGHPFQLRGNRVAFFAQLPAVSDRWFALYEAVDGDAEPFDPMPSLSLVQEPGAQTAVIDTGRAQFRVAAGQFNGNPTPPLLAVRGEDGIWRGQGRLRLPPGVTVVGRSTRIKESGPLVLSVEINYRLSTEKDYQITLTAHRDEAYLLAHEVCPDVADAGFEFSLREFAGGRGFLHWTPEGGDNSNLHWRTLRTEDRELARLQESIAWWIPPCGFAYAMTADGLQSRDYIAVFTIRRGDWIDRKFERLAQGPGDGNRELDWPFPEMVGSTISMITAQTDASGDAFFRFGFFDGERRWGILASTLEQNDGPWKEISAVQHKNSSPRLDDFKDWRLDEQDHIARPFVVARQGALRTLRTKKHSPAFTRIWGKINTSKAAGAAAGLRFAVDGDPLVAWRKKIELVSVAKIRSRMTLLGRDFADMYSPVGARPITPWVEEYDLIAASGVFTPDEERLVRQFFMLMGHLYMEPDLMNWKFNSRNANFEADRVDVVGAIGLAFQGNPDAAKFVDHAAELMEKSVNVYCTPGSGKWYENPACYYLHAAKCRLNLAFHLASHGIMDPTEISRLKDFLRWGILLLMPPCPHDYDLMRDGTDEAGYRAAGKVRRIAPVGDHAQLGPWVPDHYAFMSKLYRASDPDFADLLLWAWQAGGADGSYYGNLPLIFASMSEEELQPAAAPVLTSRRLEGFGAVFRGNFGQNDEFYLLLKQGPGGYRYHRSEGSIILFADGKPLIYDGGEAGETWRHTTLSFHDVHMPLAPGHVERFHSFPALDFVQGVHPVALRPSDPVFLSDNCHHKLVKVAYERFAEPNPADSRSVFWVKDDYLILHDELNLDPSVSSHWHLQVVSNSHEGSWKTDGGYRFKGRFGTDLQVLLPDQVFSAEQIAQLPILDYNRTPDRSFAMRHLMLNAEAPRDYLAVLRPLGKGANPVGARLIRSDGRAVGIHVTGDRINDHVFFSRRRATIDTNGIHFEGCYGALLHRGDHTTLILLDGGKMQWGKVQVESGGAAVHLTIGPNFVEVVAEGSGIVAVDGLSRPVRLDIAGGRTSVRL